MQYALVLSLCLAAGSPVAPSRDVEVEAAARAFRIESYNRCREDRERYQQLRDADDDLRVGLAATTEHDLAGRQEEAMQWYREATAAVHANGDVPASPAWLTEALADAAAGKLREKKNASFASKKTPAKPAPSKNVLPPQLAPTKPVAQATEANAETPFFFVNAAIRAVSGIGTSESPQFEVQEPVIDPPGPIVDGRVQEPETAPAKGSRRKAAETKAAPQVEPTMELPTLGAEADEQAPSKTPKIQKPSAEMPTMELPELSSN
ncbi:MAG TPA: hypothetical protein VGN57_18575 [Pirellulaceae bacterium]|jgi:hypothetical protein|nr:hypothetical protein [Pirellulaceae bacterium]